MSGSFSRRLIRKGILPLSKRNFNLDECLQLQEMTRTVNAKRWEADQIRGNTALVPDGKKVVEQLDAIANLLDQARRQWIGMTLVKCGYPAGTLCDINISTGQIILKQ